jgi:3-methyladenine DNA glycosylase AlkD
LNEIIKILKENSDEKVREGMARYGINADKAMGVKIPVLRNIAKQNKKDHELALQLWGTDIHEARILATMIADPKKVDEKQMERWVKDFNSWDLCDQCCMNLFDVTSFAWQKASEWSTRSEEYVKRAAFALMASLSLGNKNVKDKDYQNFFSVKKAVNWALRQIGKRNKTLNALAIECGENIMRRDSKAAKWIATDALRELKSDAVQRRLIKK